MGAGADRGDLVDLERVLLDQHQLAGKGGIEFGEGGEAAAVALDRDDACASVEQGAGEAARAGADFINALAV